MSPIPRQLRLSGLLLLLALGTGQALAAEIRVAVASNFAAAMRDLASAWEQASGHRVTLVTGSTGKLYAQIRNGAPLDAFFAADAERPQRLESAGVGVPHSRFTYAIGRLVLWSPQAGLVDKQGAILRNGTFQHIAAANPRLAPYGRAAQQVMQATGVWNVLQDRLVRGENIGQTFHFVASGNVPLGFVAWSQLRQHGAPDTGSHWLPQADLYDPIEQQALLLSERPAARQFLAFTAGSKGRAIIRAHGYALP